MKAFKCDRCKRFVEGPGNGIILMPKEDHDKREYVRPQELDLCDGCWAKFKLFLDILDPLAKVIDEEFMARPKMPFPPDMTLTTPIMDVKKELTEYWKRLAETTQHLQSDMTSDSTIRGAVERFNAIGNPQAYSREEIERGIQKGETENAGN